MKKTCKVMLAEFPGDFVTRPVAENWMRRTFAKCKPDVLIEHGEIGGARFERWTSRHENISEVLHYSRTDTPIDMVRNHCLKIAQQYGVDYVLLLDNDMEPDQSGPRAALFWETAFPWIFDRPQPAVIFAPYCGGLEGYNNVFVFRWQSPNNRNDHAELVQFSREEAASRGGIEQVHAGPTGLMLIDMRILARLRPPYFYYGFAGDGKACQACGHEVPGIRTHKSLTEDCAFTRDVTVNWSSVPDAGCFCIWDSWAKHHKICAIPRPEHITKDQVGFSLRHAVELDRESTESVQMIRRTLPPAIRSGHDEHGRPFAYASNGDDSENVL